MPRRIPPWLDWELHLTKHVKRRMIDRGFNEVDLREMLEEPEGVGIGAMPGRWIFRTRLHGRSWKVVVEPDWFEQRLVVITAYAPGSEG